MKRLQSVLLAAAVFVLAPAVSAQPGAGISDKERASAIEYLTTMRDLMIAESSTLTEAQWNFKTAPERIG